MLALIDSASPLRRGANWPEHTVTTVVLWQDDCTFRYVVESIGDGL